MSILKVLCVVNLVYAAITLFTDAVVSNAIILILVANIGLYMEEKK